MTNGQLLQARAFAAAHTTDSSWDSCSTSAMTATIGHFGFPVNCAVPSPNGQHVAVVGDAPRAWVVSAKHGYEWLSSKSRTFNFAAKMAMKNRTDMRRWETVSEGMPHAGDYQLSYSTIATDFANKSSVSTKASL